MHVCVVEPLKVEEIAERVGRMAGSDVSAETKLPALKQRKERKARLAKSHTHTLTHKHTLLREKKNNIHRYHQGHRLEPGNPRPTPWHRFLATPSSKSSQPKERPAASIADALNDPGSSAARSGPVDHHVLIFEPSGDATTGWTAAAAAATAALLDTLWQ